MRTLYNIGGFEKRVKAGIWTGQIVRSNLVTTQIGPRVPLGSHSQKVVLFDEGGNQVAELHRYITPLGTIGGWGKNDPKRITINGTTYHQAPIGTVPILRNKTINRILDRRGLIAVHTYVYWLRGQVMKALKELKAYLGFDVR